MNMKRMNKYIEPDFLKYSSFYELEKRNPFLPLDFEGNRFAFDDFFKLKRLFVVAEPGYGKTRLLKEIIVEAMNKKMQGTYIDLKKVDSDLESFVSNPKKIVESITPDNSEEELKRMTLFKTDGFSLEDSYKTIICLDALDEVKQQDFSNIVDWIKYLSKKFKNTYILISCRRHHLKKYHELFSDMDFHYIYIEAFNNEQVKTYLEKSDLTGEQIKRITEIAESGNRQLPLDIPRYLEMLIDFIEKNGIDRLQNLSRGELYEFFIYQKLEIEEKKINRQYKDITKRILEKLALLMEIYQTNILSKDELITFFEDVKSDLKSNFSKEVPLQLFFDRSLLKDNIDTIEFENTSFQEYLAAREIKRLGRTDQIVFDLAVDKELREIYPSWLDTLEFVIDLDISILKPILHFGTIKGKIVETDEYYRLLTTVDTNRLTLEDRKEIFKIVFIYYQEKSTWIDPSVAKKLAFYFDASQNNLLREYIDERKSRGLALVTKRANVANILAFLFENEKFNQEEIDYWKNKLIVFTKEENSVLNRNAVFALSKFKDLRLIEKVSHLLDIDDNFTIHEFIHSCIEIDPNDLFSIQCFVKCIKKDESFAKDGLDKITEKKAIKYLLDCFINDPKFFLQFLDPRFSFHDKQCYKIAQNIRKVYDSDIEKKIGNIIKIIIRDHRIYSPRYTDFVENFVELIKENNRNYIYNLITYIKETENIEGKFYDIVNILSMLLDKEQVERFVKEMKLIEGGERIAFNTFYCIKSSDRNDSLAIYEEGRKYFEEEYKNYEGDRKIQPMQENLDEKVYEKFRFKLEPEKGKYYPDVFSFYLNNKDKIDKYIKVTDKERLTDLITKSIFEKHNPEDQKLFITKRKGDSIEYSVGGGGIIQIFGDCIIIASEFNIDISKYKQKIVKYIPYAYDTQLEAIFSLLPKFSSDDIDTLLRIYSGKRKDDLSDFNPRNLIKASEKYNISKAIPILKRFVDKDLSISERTYALEVVTKLNSGKVFLKEIFEKYRLREDDTFELSINANEFLIEKHSDNDAIKWRFNLLMKETEKVKGLIKIPQISHKGERYGFWAFAKPLINLKNTAYIEQFLTLLDKSFEIYNKGAEHQEYAIELWGIVIKYFKNLRENRTYRPLKALEDYISKNSIRGGINWFTDRLRELKREYLNYIGKPQYFSECLKKYNRFKEQQYLEIASVRDLFEILKEIIESDIRKWVEDEGAYRFIRDARGRQEDLIQKTIKTQLENSILRRGFRDNDINIKRESQLLDDQRTDFLIYYGFIGPVLMEIKRFDNQEIQNESKRGKYSKKLIKYMEATNSELGIYLIFKIKEGNDLNDGLEKVRKSFGEYNKISVIGLDCIIDTI